MPDAGTHVAMVASWPGVIPKGQVLDALVDFTDVMPTLAEVAQARLPQDRPLDGQTFMPQLRGESTGGRPWVFCHYSRDGTPLEPAQPAKRNLFLEQQQEQRQAKKLGRFARGQRYKLYDDGRLYDVQQDVLEEHEIKPGKGSSAAEQARAQLQEVHAKMPPWEPFRPRE
jgi:arylsulfatase A